MENKHESVDEALKKISIDILKAFEEGYTLADVANITADQMEALYALAYQNYGSGNFEQAKNIFKLLCMYDATCFKYYMGLAASQQSLGDYENAAQVYAAACVMTGLLDPQPMYFAAICLLKCNKKEDAIHTLEGIAALGREGNVEDQKFKLKAANLCKVLLNSKEA